MPFLSKEMAASVRNEIVLHPPDSNARCSVPPALPRLDAVELRRNVQLSKIVKQSRNTSNRLYLATPLLAIVQLHAPLVI